MDRLSPEEDPVRSALTSKSGKYASKEMFWYYIPSYKIFPCVLLRWFYKVQFTAQLHALNAIF